MQKLQQVNKAYKMKLHKIKFQNRLREKALRAKDRKIKFIKHDGETVDISISIGGLRALRLDFKKQENQQPAI